MAGWRRSNAPCRISSSSPPSSYICITSASPCVVVVVARGDGLPPFGPIPAPPPPNTKGMWAADAHDGGGFGHSIDWKRAPFDDGG
jgi:hypothetical protein